MQTLGLPQESYSYDAVHNRATSGHQPGAWNYNEDNQLTQYPHLKAFEPAEQTLDTAVSYTAQGHTSKESNSRWTKDYHYSAAERLIRYTQTSQGQSNPQIEAHYRYDPFGRRIAKTIQQGGTTKTTYYIYSEHGLMAEADEEGKLTRAYGFNPIAAQQGLWSTDPIWQANIHKGSLTSEQTSYHYLHTDHLGTPMLATTKDGNTSWKAVSEAFGAAGVLQSQSSITMNLRLPGQYFDEETHSHYNFHRDYRPNMGRYLQSDPIGTKGGVNVYIYARNNPLGGLDDRGLFSIVVIPIPPFEGSSPGKGCGDISTDKFVPDKYVGFNFSSPCRKHDKCYGTCGSNKKVCDMVFYYDMLFECIKIFFIPPLYQGCRLTATAYYGAVSAFGQSAFCAAQKEDCPDCSYIPGCL